MTIQLIPAGDVVETDPSMPTVKRGRGRPKGSLNKPKVVNLAVPPAPEEEQPEEQQDESDEQEAPDEEEEEQQEEEPTPPPPPRAKRRRPEPVVVKANPKRQPIVRAETPSPPETPRGYRTRVLGEYREHRVNQHAERQTRFTSMLNRFMH